MKCKAVSPRQISDFKNNNYPGCLIILAVLVVIVLLSSCCRPATEFQVAKWEKRHKFESPRGFWGIHLFNKSKNKKYVIKYKNK